MSFFSRSSKGKHYKNGHRGSTHYQKQGLFGSILNMLDVSHSKKGHGYQNNQQPYNQPYQQPVNSPSVGSPTASVQGSVNCRKCQAVVPAGSKFCLQCGEKMATEAFCMECGEKLPSNAKFCMQCGKKVNP